MKAKTPKTKFLLAPALLGALLPLYAARADAQLDKIRLADYVQSVKLSGDLRLREEDNFITGSPKGTDRRRFRLRVGADVALPNDFYASFRLASGKGEQVSTNQSFETMSSQKAIWIDTAYLGWARQYDNSSLYVQSGRMANRLWRVTSSDLIWDDDINPEGFAQGGELMLPDLGVTLFANLMQLNANGSPAGATSAENQWVFSEQAGLETKLPFDTRIRTALAYHKWSGENLGALGGTVQDGNRASGGVLVNQFGVAEWTTQLSGWVSGLPVAFQGTMIRNVRSSVDRVNGPLARDGYEYGLIAGKAAAKGTWEAALFYKKVEADATVAAFADSDFGNGGTNRRGAIMWLAYAPYDWMQLKAKYFDSEMLDTSLGVSGTPMPGGKDWQRLPLDMVVKF